MNIKKLFLISLNSLIFFPISVSAYDIRPIDGSCTNFQHCEYGQAGQPLIRLAPPAYGNGVDSLAGQDRPNPRTISNEIFAQTSSKPNTQNGSAHVWIWGQFLDHDLSHTPSNSQDSLSIPIPTGDPFFDPNNTGMQSFPFNRSINTTVDNHREQINKITSFIDASQVYGSDPLRAAALRTFSNGLLKTTSSGLFLPFNTNNLPNDGSGSTMFLAGDLRANEQLTLIAMHTLFVREHNRWAARLKASQPNASDEDLYQQARKIIGAVMQVITYKEFLPKLLGPNALPAYTGYNENVDPRIANEFSTASYRFGHSTLGNLINRVSPTGTTLTSIRLRDAFFKPSLLTQNGNFVNVLIGGARVRSQDVDTLVADSVRNFLFGAPGQGGIDLVTLNIQRGRDHGLADYNSVRKALGLTPRTSFNQITSNTTLQNKLSTLYQSVDNIDLWVGGLAEDHVSGSMLGETMRAILINQFTRLRDGDRFWYQNDDYFKGNPSLLQLVESATLSRVIRHHIPTTTVLQSNAFTF